MAFTVVQHKKNDIASGGQTTLSVTVTSTGAGNRIIVAFCGVGAADPITSITGGGTYTQVASSLATDATGGTFAVLWQNTNVSGGVTTIMINFSSTGFPFAEVWEISGTGIAADGAPIVKNNGATSTTPTGNTMTPTTTSSFLAAIVVPALHITVNPSAGNAFTSGGDIGANTFAAGCSLITTSTSGQTPQWDQSASGTYAVSSAIWKETGGGGPTTAQEIPAIMQTMNSGGIIGRVDA